MPTDAVKTFRSAFLAAVDAAGFDVEFEETDGTGPDGVEVVGVPGLKMRLAERTAGRLAGVRWLVQIVPLVEVEFYADPSDHGRQVAAMMMAKMREV